jgi:hypothetical protein
MPLDKPYYQIYRHGPDEVNRPFIEARRNPEGIQSLRTYEILKKDFRKTLEYIEPSESNMETHSHRNYELLLRICTEIETQCKFIFEKNGVQNPKDIIRYSDLNGPMKLSQYEINCYWFELPSPIKPFASFADLTRNNRSPSWYKAYNKVKHNRLKKFPLASLQNVIESLAGLYTILTAQYGLGFDHALILQNSVHVDMPDLFRAIHIEFWDDSERYDFNWNSLSQVTPPFDQHPLSIIP